jgi:chromosome segregation ATPase
MSTLVPFSPPAFGDLSTEEIDFLSVLWDRIGRAIDVGGGTALQEKLLRQDLFEEFCKEFTREMNRLRMEYRANLSSAERELEHVRAGIRRVIDAIKDGFAGPELRAEMDELQARKESLLAQLATADAPVPLLHPNLAALYREKVATLASVLQNAESRSEAAEALRGLMDAIVLVPAGNEL